MKIIVVGAGQVGRAVAVELVSDHELHVVDYDTDNLEQVPYEIDVTRGDATEQEVLTEAGVETADILLATTDLDQTNLIVCNTAKLNSDVFTIARVTNTDYVKTWNKSRGVFGVDLMLGRALLSARTITRLISYRSRRQTAREVENFAGGKVQMAVYEIPESSQVAGKKVMEADRFEELTFGAIFRDDEMIFPRGQDTIEIDDRLVVIGPPERVQDFGRKINPVEVDSEINDLLLFGGGKFGYQIARQLEKHHLNLRVIEKDNTRARFLAENLPEALVLEGDASESGLWERENFGRTDMAVVALPSEQENLLVSLLAKQHGIPQVVSIVREKQYVDLFESTAVDLVVNPRDEVAEEIIRHIKVDFAQNITSIEHHRGTVFELRIKENSSLANQPLQKSISSLYDQMTVGAIIRGEEVLTPRGDTEIIPGDRLVILAPADVAEDIAESVK